MRVQAWNGIIVAVGEDSFIGRFLDLKNPTTDLQLVEIDIAKLPQEELEYLGKGAVVIWTIDCGAEESSERISMVHEPSVTLEDVQAAKRLLRQFLEL